MERTFTVSSKGLFGKMKAPMIKLKNDNGESMALKLASKAELKKYPIETVITIRIAKEQKNIG